ncbi:MAG: lasso peptide biosynthesis B2 protein [Rubrivivax sp.]|nr:MAG: lasso peptide biosynthesis B2 protein [Rubrivivax sp.]
MTHEPSICAISQGLTPLHVASHVRICSCDGVIVLLDLRRSRYLSVAQTAARSLMGQVDGWCTATSALDDAPSPTPPLTPPPTPFTTPDAQRMVQRLLALGILCRGAYTQPPAPAIEEACESFDADAGGEADAFAMTTSEAGEPPFKPKSGISALRLARFAWSTAVSACWLRFFSLHTVVRRVTERLAPLPIGETESCTASGSKHGTHRLDALDTKPMSEAMRSALVAFDRLRPLAFTARDRCLHDSLALTMFLASEGHRARWVIGVKLSPFGAHSWVQYGRTVLNDQHDYVRAFRPILVV